MASPTKVVPVPAPEPETPVLSAEEKLGLVLLQRQVLALQIEITNKQKQLENYSQNFQATLNGIVDLHKIDKTKFTFDLENLILVPIQK